MQYFFDSFFIFIVVFNRVDQPRFFFCGTSIQNELEEASFFVPLYQFRLVYLSLHQYNQTNRLYLKRHSDEFTKLSHIFTYCSSSSITDCAPSAQQAAISVAVFG
jgi:hypothetical protein